MGKIQEEAEFSFPADELPTAAATKHHQLSVLKQHTQISLASLSPEVQEGSGCCVLSCFSHVQLCDPMNHSPPPGSSVCGILQATILEWVAMPSSRGSSWPRDQTHISYISCTEVAGDVRDMSLIPESHWAKIKESPGFYSFWFPASRGCCIPGCEPFLGLQREHHQAKSFSNFYLFDFLFSLLPFPPM